MSENAWYLRYWTIANGVNALLHILQLVLLFLIWRKL